MKQKAKKIVIVLLALLLVTGAIILCSNKLVFGLNYEKNNKVELNLGKQFEVKDIKEITNEIFGSVSFISIKRPDVLISSALSFLISSSNIASQTS